MKLTLIEYFQGDDVLLPFNYYDIWVDNKAVGKISLRFGNNFHSYYNGHVGFEIFPEHQGNNYAYEAMRLLMNEARDYNIVKILLTCDESNKTSKHIFEKLGARYIETTKIPEACFFYKPNIESYLIYELFLTKLDK